MHRRRLSSSPSEREREAKHCNSCLLIISASISRSKPPANADRTLSLSRPLHFVVPSLHYSSSLLLIPPRKQGRTPRLVLSSHPRNSGIRERVGSGNTVDTTNNLITSHRQCVVSHWSTYADFPRRLLVESVCVCVTRPFWILNKRRSIKIFRVFVNFYINEFSKRFLVKKKSSSLDLYTVHKNLSERILFFFHIRSEIIQRFEFV